MFGNIPARKILKFITSKRILLAAIVLGFLLSSHLASAEGYRSLVKIPGMPENPDVFEYLGGLYKFLISAIGVVAMGAIVIGGARYLTSVGNPAAIEDAKHTIYSAITGLILALSTWVIISEINPDILVLKKPGMPWTGGRYEPAARDPLAMCAPGPQGYGTDVSPCFCVDNPNQKVTFTQPSGSSTNLTLTSPVSGSSFIVGSSITIEGKLTKTNDDSPIVGKVININVIDDKFNRYNYRSLSGNLTDSNGKFSVTYTGGGNIFTQCGDPLKLQAVFSGETDIYIKSASNVVNFTVNGPPDCNGSASGFFPYSPAQIFNSAFGAITCKDACSNPATPGLSPSGYHCMKAELKLGTTLDLTSASNNVTANVNQKIFFDFRSGSADYAWPGLNIDVPAIDPTFDNGIDSYLIKYIAFTQPWNNNPTDSSNILSAWISADNLWYEPSSACSSLGAFTGWVADIFGGKAGMGNLSYAAVGDYKIVLNVRSKNGCLGPAVDIGYIHVK